ncbi:MAG: diaminopropionate ammonia-lyase [Burkholderiales bacterium]|nr:diaminopropionate ammonia-lyase [Burkholderiales bacterium]
MRYADLVSNPRFRADLAYGPAQRAILGGDAFTQALATISAWPAYAPTPLRSLPGLAAQLGLGAVDYKDEAERFSLASFKALGGAYAVARLLGSMRDPSSLTVTCATEGNHGRSVAWGAHRGGCRCVIYVHAGVGTARIRAIEELGAKVVRVSGNYDDSVRHAACEAAQRGWTVISDTSYPGYTDIPRSVMQGYAVLVHEAMREMGSVPPTHVFVQGGVGGLAAAVAAHFWEHCGSARPLLVVVEPDRADCLLRSARAGRPQTVRGALDTVMAGLACGEPSLLAWTLLQDAASAFMSIPDESALQTMRLIATPQSADPPIVAGGSGAAGLAGLIAAAADATARSTLRLNDTSRVLVIGTEGATDPEFYANVVGRSAQAVAAARASSKP